MRNWHSLESKRLLKVHVLDSSLISPLFHPEVPYQLSVAVSQITLNLNGLRQAIFLIAQFLWLRGPGRA